VQAPNPDPPIVSPRALLVLTLVSLAILSFAAAVMPRERAFPDVVCYWAAAKLVASGQSPYDIHLQTAVQRQYGWDKETTGFGVYDFLPYYYPPWFGLLWVVFLPLGFSAAKFAWFFLNVELTLVTGYLLKDVVPGMARWAPVALAGLFVFSLACALLGQTAILVFFLAALSWRLLEAGRDRSAGVALAWLTIKPQLTAVLLLAVLLRLALQRRWNAVGAFFLTLLALALLSTLLVPSWPLEMLRAPRRTPSPTEHYPWIGNTWFLLLKALHLRGWLLWALYLAVALPFLAAVVRRAFDRGGPLLDLVALGALAAFFVSPYARHYDFPILLIPLLALLRRRPASPALNLLLLAVVFLPYVQFYLLAHYKPLYNPSGLFLLEGSFFWVPAALAAAWAAFRPPGPAFRGPADRPAAPL
jgi:hypothetical protein